jgi:hypothetical protein
MKERRRAVDGKLIEVSKSNPGYYKYQFTIRELDGDENIIPSYGVDMTDALQRILKNEKKEKLNDVYVKKVEPTVMISAVLSWLTMIGLSMFIPDRPEYALYGTIGLMSIVMAVAVYNFIKNINK